MPLSSPALFHPQRGHTVHVLLCYSSTLHQACFPLSSNIPGNGDGDDGEATQQ